MESKERIQIRISDKEERAKELLNRIKDIASGLTVNGNYGHYNLLSCLDEFSSVKGQLEALRLAESFLK